MGRRFIFGLGTGRCGTVTLSKLLSSQASTNVSHELGALPFLPWEKDRARLQEFLGRVCSREESFVGDISFYLLPYVNDIVDLIPDSKFIVLQRDKEETVRSYVKKTEGRNHWVTHDGTQWRNDHWDKCYPKYLVGNKEEAIGKYYDEYYSKCQEIKNENFFFMNTSDLNSENKCLEMLNFCGYNDTIFRQIHENKNNS